MTYEIPLLVSAIVFAAFLVFKFRPALGNDGRAHAAALAESKKRIEAAKDDAAKAMALADAADACANLGRVDSAVGFYGRAFRADPASSALVERAARSLARKPGSLEKLMWRHLAIGPGEGAAQRAARREATRTCLRTLIGLYGKRPRTRVRQQALEHVLALIDESA